VIRAFPKVISNYNFNLFNVPEIIKILSTSVSTLFVLMLLAGVDFFESTRVSLVLAIQVFIGLIICSSIPALRNQSETLKLGASITLGTAIPTVLHQLLRGTIGSSVAWLLPIFLLLIPFFQKNSDSENRTTDENRLTVDRFAAGLLTLTMLGLADQWWWLYPPLIAIVILQFSLNAFRSTCSYKIKILFRVGAISLVFICTFWALLLRKMNYLWWILSFDIGYLESISFSVNKWGARENISAAGSEISYHWFALAWSGMTSEISNADAWTISTVAAPILVVMGIACLVYSNTFLVTGSFAISFLATATIMILRDVVSLTSLTHLYAFLSFLLIAYVVLAKHRFAFDLSTVLLIFFLVFVLYGSKVSTGAVIVSALSTLMLATRGIGFVRTVLTLMSLGLSTFLAYFYFFGQSVRPASLVFGLSDAGGRLLTGRPLPGGGLTRFLFESFALLLFYFPFVCIVLSYLTLVRKVVAQRGLNLLAWISITALLLSRLLDGEGTESYFLFVSYPTSFILIFYTIHTAITHKILQMSTRKLLILVVAGLTLGVFREVLSDRWIEDGGQSLLVNSAPHLLLIFILFLIVIFVCTRTTFRVFSFQSVLLIFTILLTSAFAGEQIHQRMLFVNGAFFYRNIPNIEMTNWNYFAGSPDQQESLSWIKDNVPADDLIATNRRCLAISFCGPPKWMLVSALAEHKVLIDGNRTGLPDSTPWIDERIILSERFIAFPNESDFRRLKELDVKYFYVELAFINKDINGALGFRPLAVVSDLVWSPYADVVQRTSTTLVLKLNSLPFSPKIHRFEF
jgi:hypothetical protein